MTQTIHRKLNDSAFARWTALILISLMMFFAYMFVDMLSPLKELLDTTLNWNSTTFGTYAASEYFLNVFCFFLIFAGIILDKMGIRFTGLLSASLMVISISSSITGYIPTEAKLVWRRALLSNGDIRTKRCTPLSDLSHP